MNSLPTDIIAVLTTFAPLFSRPVFEHVKVLLCGAVLATGKRTVTSALRAVGLEWCQHFENYHRVLNRDRWSGRLAAYVLLSLLVRTFAPAGPVVIGIDETVERRRGPKISAKGVYRDAVRSTKGCLIKTVGLRWISMMLLVHIPWAERLWALPFMTVLAPSEAYAKEKGKKHKTVAHWAREMILQVRRWLPDREIFVIGDSAYAVLELLKTCIGLRTPVTLIARLRLDAVLHELPPERKPGTIGRPAKKGPRLPKLQEMLHSDRVTWSKVTVSGWYGGSEREVEAVSDTCLWYNHGTAIHVRWVLIRHPQGRSEPMALVCTNLDTAPAEIISYFVRRWQVEVTFQEVRTHLGVETQRQWNDLAIARTTPALMGLFSLVTLMAHERFNQDAQQVRRSSWYIKERLTFSDAIACVRRQLWHQIGFGMTPVKSNTKKTLALAYQRMADMLCYAT